MSKQRLQKRLWQSKRRLQKEKREEADTAAADKAVQGQVHERAAELHGDGPVFQ
jgi:hypothetical protein